MAKDKAVLDFGSEKITVLTGARGVNDSIQVTSLTENDYDGFTGGEWLRPEMLSSAVSSAINSAENSLNTKIKDLFIGVPGEFCSCVVKSSSVSFGKKRKITQSDLETLFMQGNDFTPTANTLINRQPIYYTLDDDTRLIEPVGMASKSLSGLICYIFAEQKFTNSIDSILKNIGIETAEYVSATLAQSLFLLDELNRDKISVLIDIGHITATVAVVRGDGLLSLNSFSLGGGHITGDLAGYFKISFADAEALKRKVMISLRPTYDEIYEVNGKEFQAQLVNKMVNARIAVMAKAVAKCLEKCPYEIPKSTGVYLTGGGISYLRGAKELLGQFLGSEVEVISAPLPPHNKPHLSSAISVLNMTLNSEEQISKKGGLLKFLLGK